MLTAAFTRLKKDEMTRHGILMVAFVALGGIFNYGYQLAMGIILMPEQYGILVSLTSLLVILQVFSQTITMAVSRKTSTLKQKDQWTGIAYLWHRWLRQNLIISVVCFVLLALASPIVSRLLDLENIWYVLIIFTSIIFLLPISVNWGVMQGLQRFTPFGLSQSATYLLRLVVGVLFVYAGWGTYGGLAAVPVSFALVLPYTLASLKGLPKIGTKPTGTETRAGSFAGLTMLALLAITVMTNVDVIFARHYLSAVETGNYSALSILGRISFYAPYGVGIAMFPKTTELYEQGGNHRQLLWKALLLTGLIAGSVVLAYAIFPGAIMRVLFGDKYPLATPFLMEYAGAMALYAIALLSTSYLLSLKKTGVAYPLFVLMGIQIILISIFHTQMSQLVHVMLISAFMANIVTLPFVARLR